MKSIKNHLSLILALVSILFAMQTLTVTNRSIDAYKEKLKTNYSLVVVSNTKLDIYYSVKSKCSYVYVCVFVCVCVCVIACVFRHTYQDMLCLITCINSYLI